jgi:hypothetical protein
MVIFTIREWGWKGLRGYIDTPKDKKQLVQVALTLLSPCSQVALFRPCGIETTLVPVIRLLNEEVLSFGEWFYEEEYFLLMNLIRYFSIY